MRSIITISFIFFAVMLTSADTGNVAQADSLYNKGDFLTALQLYEQTDKLDGSSLELLFNMGNAAVKANRYGTAMVAYQRAASIAPGNTSVHHNIEYLMSKIDDRNNAKLGGKKGDMTMNRLSGPAALWQKITTHVNPDTWGWLALISFVLMLGGVLAYFLAGNVMVRKIGFFTAIVCIVLSAVLNIFTYSARHHWSDRQQCVVTAFDASIRPKPDKDAKPDYPEIVAGTLLGTPQPETVAPAGWVYVRLNSTVAGWIKADDITVL